MFVVSFLKGVGLSLTPYFIFGQTLTYLPTKLLSINLFYIITYVKIQTQAIVNGKHVFNMAWDRAKSYNAIPKWSKYAQNRRKILKIYIEAQIRNIHSKTKYQIDHIIPLYHKKVCGLHVHENLQILSSRINANKSNSFSPYREINGRKYYYERVDMSQKDLKIPKKHNRTKKNPLKLAKKRKKSVKNTSTLFRKYKRK